MPQCRHSSQRRPCEGRLCSHRAELRREVTLKPSEESEDLGPFTEGRLFFFNIQQLLLGSLPGSGPWGYRNKYAKGPARETNKKKCICRSLIKRGTKHTLKKLSLSLLGLLAKISVKERSSETNLSSNPGSSLGEVWATSRKAYVQRT